MSPRSPETLWDEQGPRPVDRVAVIGLDCASPWLFLERWADALPHLSALRRRGVSGPLRSCHPPITVPAWMIMASGQDAGHHGVYGFRSRTGPGYGDLSLTQRGSFHGTPLWDALSAEGLRSLIVGVPGTWPPRPLLGAMVTGPLTPDDAPFSWPPELAVEVTSLTDGQYLFDVPDFRNLAPEVLLAQVKEMTARRLDVVLALARRDDWNLLWSVEIGLDRLYHALWHHIDPTHPRFIADSPLADALLDYHRQLDEGIGALMEICDDGHTAFAVVSDHGARSMEGGILINEWLRRRGLLVLKEEPAAATRFDPALVDWPRTRAWAMGGYCGRIFLNRQGREPQGVVPLAQVDPLLAEIAEGLTALPGPDGAPLVHEVHRPEGLYERRRGWAPELMVYFGDLGWRALDSVGGGSLYAAANDSGPDAANHAWDGLFVAAGGGLAQGQEVQGMRLLDVAPLVRRWLDVEGELR